MPNKGDLRVWWIPQIPGDPFYVDVASPDEAVKIIETLGRYDEFQLNHNIKPDYSNAGGLEVFDEYGDGDWCEWYHPETGDSIDEWGPDPATPPSPSDAPQMCECGQQECEPGFAMCKECAANYMAAE